MMVPQAQETTYERHQIIIVGSGPVGLFLGLTSAQKGIEVLVLEAESGILPSPRALMYIRACEPNKWILLTIA
jgi:2-polyprenyl-6-methoxyphenol hydroxylase-like FAD-dependent oxidoreductase